MMHHSHCNCDHHYHDDATVMHITQNNATVMNHSHNDKFDVLKDFVVTVMS